MNHCTLGVSPSLVSKFPLYLLYDGVNLQFWPKQLCEGLKLKDIQNWIEWWASIETQGARNIFPFDPALNFL